MESSAEVDCTVLAGDSGSAKGQAGGDVDKKDRHGDNKDNFGGSSKDNFGGSSRGSIGGSSKGSSEVSGEQVVVKEQVKAVVGDLENVLGELKTVVGDLRVLVNQIDVVTSKIDEEYGAEVRTSMEVCKVDKRRRSASILETGTPKREVPAFVRHSLSQPFDVLRPNKDWIFHAPALDFASKMSDSPRHSNSSSAAVRSKKEEQYVCHAHNVANTKIDTIYGTPKKDDIIICTPGSLCQRKESVYHTPVHGGNRRRVDLAIYENVPITTCRTPSKSGSNNSRSPRTSSGSKTHSPRTSNSSGIGNSAESGNGNTLNNKREKQRKPHRHSTKRSEMVDNTTQVDLTKTTPSYFEQCDNRRLVVSDMPDTGEYHHKRGTTLELLTNNHHHCSPCSPSPDSDYCGVYERELDLKLELIFEDDIDNNCDDRRTLDLQSYPGYGSTYDRERVSRWAAYTLVNMGSLPLSDDQLTETPSECSSDILNDNVFITTAAELAARRRDRPWASAVFDRYYKHSLESPDTG